jgi:geranylgeranyl pyrophosphate synthase
MIPPPVGKANSSFARRDSMAGSTDGATVPELLDRECRSRTLSLSEIVHPILGELSRVEDRLSSVAAESEGILKESSEYVLSGGGKRLRAALVLFASSVSGVKSSEQVESAVRIATAVELIHSATLVHDDIIDRSVIRRLKPTVNLRFGEEIAILLGDFLYARAFGMIARVGDQKITAWMAKATEAMCEGELDQLKHRFRPDLSLEDYFSFIERKTASLLSSCARSGARIAGLSFREEDACASFGLNMGICFQIIDDLLDLVGIENRLGKTLRTDFGSGKMTLPLIVLLQSLRGSERDEIIHQITSLSPRWKDIQSLVQKHRIAEKTEAITNRYFSAANQAIKALDPSIRTHLENLSCFILNRDH